MKINEAKSLRLQMTEWGGENLYNRFIQLRQRLSPPENDMSYWVSSKSPKEPMDLEDILNEIEERSKQKAQQKKIIEKGVESVYEDDNWRVLNITSFEAAQKYGQNTSICIAKQRISWVDWIERQGFDTYFYLPKSSAEKYVVIIKWDERKYQPWSGGNEAVTHIPNAPKVDTLPDVSVVGGGGDWIWIPPQPFLFKEVTRRTDLSARDVNESVAKFYDGEIVTLAGTIDNSAGMGDNVPLYIASWVDPDVPDVKKYTLFAWLSAYSVGMPLMTEYMGKPCFLEFTDKKATMEWLRDHNSQVSITVDPDTLEEDKGNEVPIVVWKRESDSLPVDSRE